jgi:uncharacterized membrane protein YcaP (DUF421 family)
LDISDLLPTAVRASLVYLLLLFVVRILGKREIGSLTAFDLIVALLLGDVSGEVIYGSVGVFEGLIAILTIGAWHLINSYAGYKSKIVERIMVSPPTVLIENGQIRDENLAAERINEEELNSALRLMGVDEINTVERATLEPNGRISVLLEDWAKPIRRADLPETGK